MLSRLGSMVCARSSYTLASRVGVIHRLPSIANQQTSIARLFSTTSEAAGKETQRVAKEAATAARNKTRGNRSQSGTYSHLAWASVLFLLAIENARRGHMYSTEIAELKDKMAGMQVSLVSDTKWIEEILQSMKVPITEENITIVTSAMENRLSTAGSVSEIAQEKKDAELAEMIKVASAAYPDKQVVPITAAAQTPVAAASGIV